MHILWDAFQFSLVRNFARLRTDERTRVNFISSLRHDPPVRPAFAPARRCLRKNQLYPAISIGLHAKMSTLYCHYLPYYTRYRCAIPPSERDRARTRTDRDTRDARSNDKSVVRVRFTDIERAFDVPHPVVGCGAVRIKIGINGRQPSMRGELESQTRYLTSGIVPAPSRVSIVAPPRARHRPVDAVRLLFTLSL